MQDWIDLDSVTIISDLHLGGAKGFQIFDSEAELAWLIQQLTLEPPGGVPPPLGEPALPFGGEHALIINGDFIDFLAEEPSSAFDPEGARAKLDAVWNSFPLVFQALQGLLAQPKRLLVINLGNHDLELALPWVRAHLTEKLTAGQADAHARLLLVTDGTGVRLRVGNTRVVCLHGNEVDSWNVTDFERLRRIGRDQQLGLDVDKWNPNAGSQLVVEVMNQIKRRYPFVDLLKPQNEAVLPILAALDTQVHGKLAELGSVAARKVWTQVRMGMGFLDAGDAGGDGQPVAASYAPPPYLSLDKGATADELLSSVERAWRDNTRPMDLVRSEEARQLSAWSSALALVSRKPKSEVLREALDKLDQDRSFDHTVRDRDFERLEAMVSPDIEVLVAGHTHLQRSLPRSTGTGHYFNSGTWARLIQVSPEMRQNPATFASIFRVLESGDLQALDTFQVPTSSGLVPLVQRRNTVVRVRKEPPSGALSTACVRAALLNVLPGQGAQPIRFNVVASRDFTEG